MRLLVLVGLAALASVPASAQTVEREVRVDERSGDDGATRVTRWVVRRDTVPQGESVEIRLDSLGARLGGLFESTGPIGARMRRFEIELDGDAPAIRFASDDDGTDPATQARVRELEADARRLVREVRSDASPRAERELDAVLSELFDLRGELRQQRAEALRERAGALRDQADALDRERQRRAADRARVIEARKRELLDDGATSDW